MVTCLDVFVFVVKFGLCLSCEVEFEYFVCGGGAFVFVDDVVEVWKKSKCWLYIGLLGVEDLSFGEWVVDDWYDLYDGVPIVFKLWMDGEDRGVFRGELFIGFEDDEIEFLFGFVVHRKFGLLSLDVVRDHFKYNICFVMDVDVRW